MPSPPQSPPLAARHTPATASFKANGGRARRGGAAHAITGECERLFCETLRSVFLGEGNMARQDSLVTAVHNTCNNKFIANNDYGIGVPSRYSTDRMMDSPSPERELAMTSFGSDGLVTEWLEMWDYVGGNRFRGFVAEKGEDEKAMFVFFDPSAVGGDLKSGLMALLELCDISYFGCSRLVACIDRHADPQVSEALTKDLGWIGFQLTTLDDFTQQEEITSEKWLFMDMDV